MFNMILKEVPLQTVVFSLLDYQGIFGVRDVALLVLRGGGGVGDGSVEDLPHKLAEVESLLDGVSRKVILSVSASQVEWATQV
jgi:hypothetical protein